MTQTVQRYWESEVAYGRELRNSHIPGPIRGRVEAHATTRPGARRPGSPAAKPGEPVGGPGAFKWRPELGQSQGAPTPGRCTRGGGGRRPWVTPQSVPDLHRPGRGHGLGLDEGQSAPQVPSGSGPEALRELTRGPRLLPLWRDPGPATLSRVSRIRPSLTPGRTSGPRGQGPGQTNQGPGKPRADARIQNPSGSPPEPGLTRTEPRAAG